MAHAHCPILYIVMGGPSLMNTAHLAHQNILI